MPDLLTIAEVAALLRTTPAAVRQKIARGQVPGVVRGGVLGKTVRVRRADLLKSLGLA